MRIWPFCIAFIIACVFSPTSRASNCLSVLEESEDFKQLHQIFEPTPLAEANLQTVFLRDPEVDHLIQLEKQNAMAWFSTYNPSPTDLIKQGDPRWPIAVMGVKLAWLAGFRFKKGKEYSYLQAPTQAHFEAFILRLNRWLIAHKKEPIRTRVVKVDGILTTNKLLNIAISAENEFILQVPYDDQSPVLTPHEVSYHLGIFLPTKVLKRAVAITRHVQNFAQFLQARKSKVRATRNIIRQLRAEQAYAIDAGHANPTAALGNARMHCMQFCKTSTYRTIYKKAEYDDFADEKADPMSELISAIDTMAAPMFKPVEALILTLKSITDMPELHDFLSDRSKGPFLENRLDDRKLRERKVRLTDEDKKALYEVLAEYMQAYGNADLLQEYELATPEAWVVELLRKLDNRIALLEEAALATEPLSP